nr:hypothetical protein [Tanacetum cinerariifolium]
MATKDETPEILKNFKQEDLGRFKKSEVTRFVVSVINCIVRRFLSSDEFNAPHSALSITSEVERGLRMGHTDVEFEEATHKVSNFSIGVEAEFNKAVATLPSTNFPFLTKIAEAADDIK